MLDEECLSASRHEKLEKQRELIRRKQKKKHAHQVLSLHMLSENFESCKREDRGHLTPKSNNKESAVEDIDGFAAFGEDEAGTSLAWPDIDSSHPTHTNSRVSSPPHNPIPEKQAGNKPSPAIRTHTEESPNRAPMNGRLMNWDMQELPDDRHSEPTQTSPVRLLCDRLQNLSNTQDAGQLSPDVAKLSVPHPGKRKERSKDQRRESAPAPAQRSSSKKLHSIQALETDTLHFAIPMNDAGDAQSLVTQVESFKSPKPHGSRKRGNVGGQKNSNPIFHNAASATESCLSLLASDTLDRFRAPIPKNAKKVTAPSSRKASCKSPPIIQLARTARILSVGKRIPSRKHRRAVAQPSILFRPSDQPTDEVRQFPTDTGHTNSQTSSTGISKAADQSNPHTRLDPTENLEEFVFQPAPKGTTVRCCITRDKRGVDRGIFPTYYVHMEQEDRKYFLLAARRRKRSATSNYIISCDATDLSRSAASFAGKLRSNFVGTQFVLYGGGKRANRRHDVPSSGLRSRASLRSTGSSCELTEDEDAQDDSKELAAIIYVSGTQYGVVLHQ
ncbi:unnamed protein product [Dicrocoelium dendriticum]|nr:unnamed protein product [Dicrocoelium dendriticum]